jgi:hypothetical protein
MTQHYGFVSSTNVGPNVKVATTPIALNGGYSGKLRWLTRQFCASINNEVPVYLSFTDMGLSGAGLGGGHCHANVEWLVRRYGGRVQFGWLIWQESTRIFDGEFHSVWINAAGEMLDVSPRLGGEEFALFLPDTVRRFDWDTMTTYCNIAWYVKEKRRMFMDFNCKPTKCERLTLTGPAAMNMATVIALAA